MSTLVLQSLKPFFPELLIFFSAIIILLKGAFSKSNKNPQKPQYCVKINYFLAILSLVLALFFATNNLKSITVEAKNPSEEQMIELCPSIIFKVQILGQPFFIK